MWDTFPRDVIEACLFADPDGSSETLAEADALPTLESAPHDGSGDSLDRSSPPDEPASLASPPARAAARADPALADPDGSSETLAEADALPTLESAPHDGSGDSLDRSSPPDEPASLASPPARAAARATPPSRETLGSRLAARNARRKPITTHPRTAHPSEGAGCTVATPCAGPGTCLRIECAESTRARVLSSCPHAAHPCASARGALRSTPWAISPTGSGCAPRNFVPTPGAARPGRRPEFRARRLPFRRRSQRYGARDAGRSDPGRG